MKSVAMPVAGVVLTVLGLIGLLIPVIPGLLFLLLAAFCFSAGAPGLRRKLRNSRYLNRFSRHWEATEGLTLVERVRLRLWLVAEAIVRPIRRNR